MSFSVVYLSLCVLCGMHSAHKSVSWFYCCQMCVPLPKNIPGHWICMKLISMNKFRTHAHTQAMSIHLYWTYIIHISIVFAFENCLFDTTEYADNYSLFSMYMHSFLTVGNSVHRWTIWNIYKMNGQQNEFEFLSIFQKKKINIKQNKINKMRKRWNFFIEFLT